MTEYDLNVIQEKIGYRFSNPALLRQAFTSPSVTEATGKKVQNYQVLEFIGDAVLSITSVIELARELCRIDCNGQMVCKATVGILSNRKQEIEKNETLAHCSNIMGLDPYVERAYGYYSADCKNKRGDLVEAILGAVALDSGWNINVLGGVMGIILRYRNIDVDYSKRLFKYCSSKRYGEPQFLFHKEDGKTECCVVVPVLNKKFKSEGEDHISAKNDACRKAYEWLKKRDKKRILSREMDVFSRLNVMYQLGEIGKPSYVMEHVCHDGEYEWVCTSTLEGIEYEFIGSSPERVKAKLDAAGALLKFLTEGKLDGYIEDDEKVVRGRGLLMLAMTKYREMVPAA